MAPGTTPTVPTDVSAVTHPGGKAAIVTFSAPTDDGGHTLTYTVKAWTNSAGNQPSGGFTYGGVTTWSSPTSPITVPGMTNGVQYWFNVLASNTVVDVVASGDGSLSSVAGPVTVGGIPSAPTAMGATSEDRQATVAWTAPKDNGGGSIQYYTIWTDPPPHSTCGDAGDWATCSALTGAAACDAQSKCRWDTSVTGYAHCAVTCTVAVTSYGADDVATVVTADSKVTISAPTVNYAEKDTVVLSTRYTSSEECECAGVYTVGSGTDATNVKNLVPALNVETCTAARCSIDRTTAVVTGLTNGVCLLYTSPSPRD